MPRLDAPADRPILPNFHPVASDRIPVAGSSAATAVARIFHRIAG
jgi:hypothetical protein